VIWRSLLNAPTLSDLLDSWLRVLSDQQLAQMPAVWMRSWVCYSIICAARAVCWCSITPKASCRAVSAPATIAQATRIMASCCCVWARVATKAACCLPAASSRASLRAWKRKHSLWRALPLAGLDSGVGGELLTARGLTGPGASTAALVERYSGNPLALKLVAEAIRDFFAGDIDAFMGDEVLIFDDIRDLLDQQFARLAPLERDILLWLAIEREPTTEAQLWQAVAHTSAKRSFLEALRSLQRRSLLELMPTSSLAARSVYKNVVTNT